MEVFYEPDFFTLQEIETLKNHKYNSGGNTPLDNFLNPFWETCAKFLPYVNITLPFKN